MSEEKQKVEQQQPTPGPGSCEEMMDRANRRLGKDCGAKQVTIPSVSPSGACKAEGCVQFQVPDVRPCFELRWGNGPKDQLETDDLEVLCIVAGNPYSNLVLKGVTIVLSVLTIDGLPAPPLPDGTPSVSVTPSEFVCFGDLPPCQDNKPEEVAREVVLVSRGAKAGNYTLSLEYCFTVEFALRESDQFKLELVAS